MTSKLSRLVFAAAVFASAAAFAERQPLERYQSIIDRQMFGQPPPGFDPTRPPSEVSKSDAKEQVELTKEQEQLKSSVRFSVINVTADGETAVGFTDNSDKVPKHYYLKLGEERDGWLVKEADAEEKRMVIAKGEIEVELQLGDDSGGGKGGASGGMTRAAAAGRPNRLATSARSPGMSSLIGRRRLREQQRAEEEAARAEETKRREEERAQAAAQQAEERAQRERDREEQRAQLQAIQEELRQVRQRKAEEEAAAAADNSSGDSGE